ncbi:RTA1 domain protein [Penicillium verhagenii]|nr:RTA1 domain protein [Penicillium verhagenii]
MCLGKIIRIYGEDIARFHPRTYTTFFVSCDITSLILQSAGGALAAIATESEKSLRQTGINLMIAGLAFQVVSLFLFIILASEFAIRVRKSPKPEENEFSGLRQSSKWKMFIYCKSWSCTLTIFIRSIFRVAELKGGFDSALANNQVDLMVLESSRVSIACIALTVAHPGTIIGRVWNSL